MFNEEARTAFAKKHCSKVYSYEGQATVIITYPDVNGRVVAYDMDSGSFIRFKFEECEVGKAFREVYRDSEPADFEWGPILDSRFDDDAGDISWRLFNK